MLGEYTDLEDFFVKNLWETKDALEHWEFTRDIQLIAQRDGFEFLISVKYSKLYHKVKEIYDSLESKYIKEKYKEDLASVIDNYKEKGFRDARIVSDSVTYDKKSNTIAIKVNLEEGRKKGGRGGRGRWRRKKEGMKERRGAESECV